ncbi:MAG: hypothetical protein QOF51_3001 [Chloroflexota bacterium]|nr:hypothetical protein [Chloroflexota bacterium]
MASTKRKTQPDIPGVQFIDREEGLHIFDEQARELLGMSGEEFVRRWNAGEFDDIADTPDIMSLYMLLPLTY